MTPESPAAAPSSSVAVDASAAAGVFLPEHDAGTAAFAQVGMPLPLVLLCGGLPRLLAQPQVALPLLQLATVQGPTGADATLGRLMLELLELCFLGLAPGEPSPEGDSLATQAQKHAGEVRAAWEAHAALGPLPSDTPTRLLLSLVPCLRQDLLRLLWPISLAQSEAIYQRFGLLARLLGVTLPATFAEAEAAAASQVTEASAQAPDPAATAATTVLQQSLERQLAYLLPGTALDDLPKTLCPYLLQPGHPVDALLTVLKQAARTVHVSIEGLDAPAVLRRMTRLLSWSLLLGLRGYRPIKGRPGLVLPKSLAAWEAA